MNSSGVSLPSPFLSNAFNAAGALAISSALITPSPADDTEAAAYAEADFYLWGLWNRRSRLLLSIDGQPRYRYLPEWHDVLEQRYPRHFMALPVKTAPIKWEHVTLTEMAATIAGQSQANNNKN